MPPPYKLLVELAAEVDGDDDDEDEEEDEEDEEDEPMLEGELACFFDPCLVAPPPPRLPSFSALPPGAELFEEAWLWWWWCFLALSGRVGDTDSESSSSSSSSSIM